MNILLAYQYLQLKPAISKQNKQEATGHIAHPTNSAS